MPGKCLQSFIGRYNRNAGVDTRFRSSQYLPEANLRQQNDLVAVALRNERDME